MSKTNLPEGICMNSNQAGLLSVAEDRLTNLIKKDPINSLYQVEQTPFARGKFATVRKCLSHEGGGEFAAKFIRKRRRAVDLRADIVHEIAVLRLAAACKRIVSLHNVFETAAEMALVLEMASGGELQRVLDEEESLEEINTVKVMVQILEGLRFLHAQNIAHLDLKPQNVLMTGTYPDCDIKLCDFGISRVIRNGVEVREILGTPDYVAPEILNFEPISLATDIWSVGVLAYVLLSGYTPFGGDTKQETFCNISHCNVTFPEDLFGCVSSAAKDFIKTTLVKDPSKRLTVEECLLHPWLSGSFRIPCNGDSILSLDHVQQSEANGYHTSDDDENDSSVTGEFEGRSGCSDADDVKSSTVSVDDSDLSFQNEEKDSYKEIPEIRHDSFGSHTVLDQDEGLPVKRPKNCCRRSSYPVTSCLSCAQCTEECCHLHTSSKSTELLEQLGRHRHSSITSSPVEISVDRGIIC